MNACALSINFTVANHKTFLKYFLPLFLMVHIILKYKCPCQIMQKVNNVTMSLRLLFYFFYFIDQFQSKK